MSILAWIGRGVAGLIVLTLLATGAWAVGLVLAAIWVVIEFAASRSHGSAVATDDIESSIAAGDLKAALNALEAARRHALRYRDLAELEKADRLSATIYERASGRTRRRAEELGYAARQNIRFVRRQLGQPEPRPAEEAKLQTATWQEGSTRFAGTLAALKAAIAALAADVNRLEPGSAGLASTLERLEHDLKRAGRDVVSLRQLLAAEELRRRAEEAKPAAPAPLPPKPAPAPPPRPAPAPPPEPRPTIAERLEGMGPRLFAWAGGVVMLLGVVFLFAFATRRGWIGPELRLVMGGFASATTLLAGLWIRRRSGALYSALAAVGVGLAGLYTTILAAAALYDYLPPLGALGCAAVVAGTGTAVSIAWSAEIVAGLALVGAMLLPVASLLQGERSLLGLGFVAIVMAAASVVALRRRWLVLLAAGAAVSAVQLVVFVADSGAEEPGHTTLLALTAVFWAIYVATGVAYQLILKTPRLGWLVPSFVLTPGVLLALAASRLLADERDEGLFLLGLTGGYALLGAVLMRRRDQRELATVLLGSASLVAVFGFADLLSGEPLAVVWAAQAPLLAWLGRNTGEARFRIPAAGYLVLAASHSLAIEAPPRELFEVIAHPGAGAWIVAVVAAAAFGFGYLLPAKAGEARGALDEAVTVVTPGARLFALWASGILSVYALSLAILEAAPGLESGHVALSAAWSALALALTVAGLGRRWLQIEWAGLALLGFAVIETVAFDAGHLSPGQAAACFWIVAAAALLAGHAEQLARTERPSPEAFAATLVGFALATAAAVRLFAGDGEGLSLLVLAAIYAAFSTGSFRRRLRDLATFDWGLSLVLATAGFAELLSGVALVAVGAGGVALLAWLSARARESRLLVGSASVLALSLGYALVHEGPPSELFQATAPPGLGPEAIALCAASCLVLVRYAPSRERLYACWAADVLGLYALSLGILELAPDLEIGHVALAAAWSAIGLALTVAGLRRRWLQIEWAGLSLIGFAVLETVAFDWTHLPTEDAAACFWIVAAAAVLAGHAEQLARATQPSAEGFAATLVSFALATAAAVRLFSGDAEGLGLLVIASVYGVFSTASFRRRLRDLATFDWGLSLVLATAAFAELLSGLALVAVGAGGAAFLAWLAARAREERLFIGSASILALTLGYVLVREAPPPDLFRASADVDIAAAAVAICATSALVLARYASLRVLWAAGLLALYALSLLTLDLAPDLETGHVALAALWSAIALALTVIGLRRTWLQIEWAGLGLLSFAALEALAFDWGHLSDGQAAACFWIVAAAALLAGHAEQLARPQRPSVEALAGTLASFALATAAAVRLFSGDGEGLSLLCLAVIYGGFATTSFWRRLRDLATLDWTLALALVTAGFSELLTGIALVAVGAGGAALLAWLAARAREQRLLVGSASVLGLALGYAFVREGPPAELFQAAADPGVGAAAIALCAGSALVLAVYAAARERLYALWATGVLGLYALSLGILAAADALGGGSSQDTFQRGHTAVSGAWALLALAFLYVGLVRRTRTFQLLGFAVFGVVLAKIFFFDLPSLTSVTRALSFMAVGALLLTAGYFYQRLARTEGMP